MKYNLTTSKIDEDLYELNVVIYNDADEPILDGQTYVCVTSEDESLAYGEEVFVPDLRRNNKKLANLVLSGE